MWGRRDFWKKKEKTFSLYPKLPEVFFYLVSASAEEKGSRALSNIIDTFPNDYPYSRCLTMHLNNTLLSCCNQLRNSLKLKLTELSSPTDLKRRKDLFVASFDLQVWRDRMWEEVRRDKEKRTLGFVCCYNDLDWLICSKGTTGPFLERPGNLWARRQIFKTKTRWIVAQFLARKPFSFISLADSFIVLFSKLLKLWSWMKTQQIQNSFPGPKRFLDFR